MIVYKVYAGKPPNPDWNKLAQLEAYIAKATGGFTRYEVTGGWVDGDGKLVTEPALVWELVVLTTPKEAARTIYAAKAFASSVRAVLGQSEVLITYEEGRAARIRR